LLANHATNTIRLIDPSTNAPKPWEGIGLTVVSGWNDAGQTNSSPTE
jgi:hypothetical protein